MPDSPSVPTPSPSHSSSIGPIQPVPPVQADPRSGRRLPTDARSALLWHGGPREVLARIVEGDPLELRALVRTELRRRALLLDADRVHLRALARVARGAPLWRGRPSLDTWLGDHVRAALEELAPRNLEVAGTDETLLELASRLGLAPAAVARSLTAFHALSQSDREAFFLAVLEGKGIDETTRRLGMSFAEVAHALRRVLFALLLRSRPTHSGSTTSEASP